MNTLQRFGLCILLFFLIYHLVEPTLIRAFVVFIGMSFLLSDKPKGE